MNDPTINKFYLNSKSLDELLKKIKEHFYIPHKDKDNPSLGKQWAKDCPETEGHDPYFDYQYNSAGFRDSEIELNTDICYFGCSMSVGIGVPLTARYSNIIDKEFNFISNNFGISGISTEEIAKIFVSVNRFIKMKRAVFLCPDIYRYRMPILKDTSLNYYNMHPQYKEIYANDPTLIATSNVYYRLQDPYFIDKFKSSIHFIAEVARLSDIKVYFSTWSGDQYYLDSVRQAGYSHVRIVPDMLMDGRARDCYVKQIGHTGITGHEKFAKNIIKAIREESYY